MRAPNNKFHAGQDQADDVLTPVFCVLPTATSSSNRRRGVLSVVYWYTIKGRTEVSCNVCE
jgi:hypothetical protein